MTQDVTQASDRLATYFTMAQQGLDGEAHEAALDELEAERQPLTVSEASQPTSAHFP